MGSYRPPCRAGSTDPPSPAPYFWNRVFRVLREPSRARMTRNRRSVEIPPNDYLSGGLYNKEEHQGQRRGRGVGQGQGRGQGTE